MRGSRLTRPRSVTLLPAAHGLCTWHMSGITSNLPACSHGWQSACAVSEVISGLTAGCFILFTGKCFNRDDSLRSYLNYKLW